MGGVGRRWWGREGGDELEEHKWQGWNWNPGTLGQSLSPVPSALISLAIQRTPHPQRLQPTSGPGPFQPSKINPPGQGGYWGFHG